MRNGGRGYAADLGCEEHRGEQSIQRRPRSTDEASWHPMRIPQRAHPCRELSGPWLETQEHHKWAARDVLRTHTAHGGATARARPLIQATVFERGGGGTQEQCLASDTWRTCLLQPPPRMESGIWPTCPGPIREAPTKTTHNAAPHKGPPIQMLHCLAPSSRRKPNTRCRRNQCWTCNLGMSYDSAESTLNNNECFYRQHTQSASH